MSAPRTICLSTDNAEEISKLLEIMIDYHSKEKDIAFNEIIYELQEDCQAHKKGQYALLADGIKSTTKKAIKEVKKRCEEENIHLYLSEEDSFLFDRKMFEGGYLKEVIKCVS